MSMMKFPNLLFNQVNDRVRTECFYLFVLGYFHEVDEAGVPLSKYLSQSLCGFVDELTQRTGAIAKSRNPR
jgi:hypothetical protein